jgi:hypothetical protein
MVQDPHAFWERQRAYSFPGLSWNSIVTKFTVMVTDPTVIRHVFSHNRCALAVCACDVRAGRVRRGARLCAAAALVAALPRAVFMLMCVPVPVPVPVCAVCPARAQQGHAAAGLAPKRQDDPGHAQHRVHARARAQGAHGGAHGACARVCACVFFFGGGGGGSGAHEPAACAAVRRPADTPTHRRTDTLNALSWLAAASCMRACARAYVCVCVRAAQALRKSFLALFTRRALSMYVQQQDGIIRRCGWPRRAAHSQHVCHSQRGHAQHAPPACTRAPQHTTLREPDRPCPGLPRTPPHTSRQTALARLERRRTPCPAAATLRAGWRTMPPTPRRARCATWCAT